MKYYQKGLGFKVLASNTKPVEKGYHEITKKQYDSILEKKQARIRIAELKRELAKTDYEAIKFAEGEMSAEEYEPYKVQRRAARAEINQLEAKY